MAVKCLRIFFVVVMLQVMAAFSSSQKAFRIGSVLRLNCSTGSNSTWWFDFKPLYNNTIINNRTTLLEIFNVSKKNQGTYWCGSSWGQGINVTVLIGDLPSPPRNLYTTSIEFDKILHFTSVESTGGLEVHYEVKIHCIRSNTHDYLNCSTATKGPLYFPPDLDTCSHLKHVNGKHYSCNLQNSELYHKYRATIYAINAVGSSSETITYERPSVLNLDTIPKPPLQLRATEIQPEKVKLSWKKIDSKYGHLTYFRIIYKKEGDQQNKTLPRDYKVPETTAVIDNLEADTSYQFYVKRQYRTPDQVSAFSSPAETSLHTRSAAPDQPPQHLRCLLLKNHSSNGNKTIQISWEPPSKQHRNGPLEKYLIFYSTPKSGNMSMITVSASHTKANLTIDNLEKTIKIYAKVCNKGELCSGISESCQIPALQNTPKKKILDDRKTTGIIIGAVFGSVCAVIVVVIAVYCWCFRKKITELPPQDALPVELDGPYTDYDEPASQEDDDYNQPLVS